MLEIVGKVVKFTIKKTFLNHDCKYALEVQKLIYTFNVTYFLAVMDF